MKVRWSSSPILAYGCQNSLSGHKPKLGSPDSREDELESPPWSDHFWGKEGQWPEGTLFQ